jgi:hypothetical protein
MKMGKITKDSIPQEYTLALAVFDAVPVVLFGLASLVLWRITGQPLVLIGGIVSFTSGLLKVVWKFLVVIRKENIWPLFVQMRIGMPIGFLLILIGFVISCVANDMSFFWKGLFRPLPITFVILAIFGMVAMIVCSSKLDPAKAGANWIEQGCNTVAQGAFFMALLLSIIVM